MKTALCIAALAATASLVACGGEKETPASATQTREQKAQQAMLKFASCMRENGVDMPDPKFDGGRVMMRQGKTDPETARKAEQACGKYRDAVKPPEMSDSDKAEMKKRALENARCMREHGIDFPDPQFEPNGGMRMKFGKGVKPESAKFKAAQEACRGTGPEGPSLSDAQDGGQ
jgi:hypothetical protein